MFFFGLLVTAALHARRVRGSIFWGMVAATALSVALKLGLPLLGPSRLALAAGERLDADDPIHRCRRVFSAAAVDRADASGSSISSTPLSWRWRRSS